MIVLTPVAGFGALWFAVTQTTLPGTRNGTFAATVDLLVGVKEHALVWLKQFTRADRTASLVSVCSECLVDEGPAQVHSREHQQEKRQSDQCELQARCACPTHRGPASFNRSE